VGVARVLAAIATEAGVGQSLRTNSSASFTTCDDRIIELNYVEDQRDKLQVVLFEMLADPVYRPAH
jgi:hypothetical protein